MYIRQTKIKSRKNGGLYHTHRLVESERTGNNVRQRTILNLGTDFALSRDKWSELATRIQQIINGERLLFEVSQEIEAMAQHYAARIIQTHNTVENAQPDYREIDVDSLEMDRPRSVSIEHVGLETFNLLNLRQFLTNLGFNKSKVAAAIGIIIGRMCHPASERATYYWLQNISGLGELIDYDFDKLSMYKIYSTSDKLLKNKEAIEKYLYSEEKQLFGFQEVITLYDLTNTYFEGQAKGNKLGKYGHSKEKRSDCPLVTLAMMLDSSGFPKSSEIFEGNVKEAATLEKMIKKLERNSRRQEVFDAQKATVVMDAGIATEENIKWLKDNKHPYIVVSRKRHREFNEDESVIIREEKQSTIKAQKVIDAENDEVLLYCHSSQREKKEQAINDLFTVRFEEAIKQLESGLPIKGRMKSYDKVMEKIGRIRQKYSKASKLYNIDVFKDKMTDNVVRIKWIRKDALNSKDELPGVYCLRTSHKEMDESTIWQIYIMLTELESVFCTLKTDLGLRPIYHQIKERVEGHLFISVLAYHLIHSIRYRLKKTGINTDWSGLKDKLTGQHRVTVSMHSRNNEIVYVRKSTRPEPRQEEIYSALGICSRPGKTIKKIVSRK